MSIASCGTRPAVPEATCIEDIIGHDGIEGFVEQALALGRGVTGDEDEEGAACFARLFVGNYDPGSGRQCDGRLRQIYLPRGYANVHLHDAVTGRHLVGIYDDGRQPVRAMSVAVAIGMQERVLSGGTVLSAEHWRSELRGVLEIALRFSQV